MKTRTLEIWVGAFIVFGICSLLMLALQVSGLSDFFREESGYKLTAEFANIGGLKVRSKVAVAGVTIGRVTDIRLDKVKYNAIVKMSIDRSHELPTDTRASILTSGLLGDNYVGFTPGFDNTLLEDGSKIEVENTDSAVLLEELISKFVTGQAGSSNN